jgi:DNA mismatch repair protein MutS
MARASKRHVPDDLDINQMSLFDMNHDSDVITELKGLNLDMMTPMDAMNTLYNLHRKAMKED